MRDLRIQMVTGLQPREGIHVDVASTTISSGLLGIYLLTSVK